jgi:hypothetical protein
LNAPVARSGDRCCFAGADAIVSAPVRLWKFALRAALGYTAPMNIYVPKVGLVSLGCPKALVDSERILTQLRGEGYKIAPGYDKADLARRSRKTAASSSPAAMAPRPTL